MATTTHRRAATWHTAKLKKCETELRIEAERNRWSLHTIVIEVGARGWIPSNVASSLARLGLPAVKNLCGKLGLLAVKSSYVIWLNRFNKDFQTWRISVGDQSAAVVRLLPVMVLFQTCWKCSRRRCQSG